MGNSSIGTHAQFCDIGVRSAYDMSRRILERLRHPSFREGEQRSERA
jgi:hypothetical protein